MSDRENILSAIRANRPQEEIPLPDLSGLGRALGDRTETFIRMLESVGGEAVWLDGRGIDSVIRTCYPEAEVICSAVPDAPLGIAAPDDAHMLTDLDLAILPGAFAVAENGAVWVENRSGGDRTLPFIAENLLLVVLQEEIVDTMHEAYARIDFAEAGFGVFISGPSKTADIEQALVIGAHGAKHLTVLLV